MFLLFKKTKQKQQKSDVEQWVVAYGKLTMVPLLGKKYSTSE